MIRSNLNIKFFFIIKIILIYLFLCSKSYSDNIATNTSSVSLGQDKAPVKIKIFSSLTCPHCANFHLNVVPEIKKEYVETGDEKIILTDSRFNNEKIPFSILILPTYNSFISFKFES